MGDTANGRKTRIIETLWLFWAFHLVGFVNGIIGPTLMDLQMMIGSTMTQMTYIFFVQGAGFIAGILLACVLEKWVNTRLIMTCSLLIGCIVNFALPWGTHFYYLAVMFFILGLAKGLVDYAALSICNQLWQDDKSVPFQFVTLAAGIASFLAPFLAEPFLAANPHSTRSVLAGGFHNHNASLPYCTGFGCSNEKSRVQYAYVIIGILCLPPVIAFAHYHRDRAALPLVTYEQFAEITTKTKYSIRECVFVTLIFLFHVPVFGILLTYSDLLAPFGVEIDIHLSKSRMAIMTSVFWGSFLAGRLLNLFFSHCLPTSILLCLNFIGWIASCIVLLFLAEEEVGLWMGTAALGVFSSPYLPMVLAWSSERMHLTGEIITASLVASGIGEIFVPFVTGQCFTVYGPRCLMYVISGAVVYEIVTFFLLVICARGVRK